MGRVYPPLRAIIPDTSEGSDVSSMQEYIVPSDKDCAKLSREQTGLMEYQKK